MAMKAQTEPSRYGRWWLLVLDVNNTIIYNQAFWTRWGARRHGEKITSPPLNRYELRKV